MLKKWFVILSIIVVLAVGCLIESNFINGAFNGLEESLVEYKTRIEQTVEEEIGSDENIEFVQSLHADWHKKLKILKCLIWHSGVKDVEVGLSRIETYSAEKNKTETLAEINALIDFLAHYSDDFLVTIENIF